SRDLPRARWPLRPRILRLSEPPPRARARRYDQPMETTEPAGPLLKAVEFLEKGEWQSAHEIVQGGKSNLAAWLHGIVHTRGGALATARSGYRRGGRASPGVEGAQGEIASARRRVTR